MNNSLLFFPTLKSIVDSELSDTSENPVQNKVIKTYIDSITISDIDSIRNNATNGQTAYEMLNGVETLLSNIWGDSLWV